MGVLDVVNAGVLGGDEAIKLYNYAKSEGFAIPAVNVVGTNSINAVLESAKKVNSPVIVQFSNGGAGFVAGKTCQEADVFLGGGNKWSKTCSFASKTLWHSCDFAY